MFPRSTCSLRILTIQLNRLREETIQTNKFFSVKSKRSEFFHVQRFSSTHSLATIKSIEININSKHFNSFRMLETARCGAQTSSAFATKAESGSSIDRHCCANAVHLLVSRVVLCPHGPLLPTSSFSRCGEGGA